MDASLKAGSLDAACFHAQQAAEKYLKAYLTHSGIEFPYTHNLNKLLDVCTRNDASFKTLAPLVNTLNPYAVELRYDIEFWPSQEAAEEARLAGLAVRNIVLTRLPQ